MINKVKIELKNLSKEYSKENIFNNVNLLIGTNEFVSISGASGSGKSTLLNILGTLDRDFKGSYILDNVDTVTLSEDSINEIRNKKIGFIFQFHHLIGQISILDNILLPVKEFRSKAKEKALALMEEFGILHLRDKNPLDISGGERQRASLLRALINDPDIILADEPTGNLDEENSIKVANMFSKIHKDFGKTIILATHDETLANMANVRYVIKNKSILSV